MSAPDHEGDLPLATRAALVNTRLAFERTLMAWVRTAISLVTLGFTLYKAFDYLHAHGWASAHGRLGPSGLALMMISLGLIALCLAIVQHYRYTKMLRRLFVKLPVISVGTVTAVLFVIVGVFALFEVVFQR